MVASAESGGVEVAGGADAQIREVAGVEPDPERFVTAPAELLEHGNRIGHARLECVDGIDEQ